MKGEALRGKSIRVGQVNREAAQAKVAENGLMVSLCDLSSALVKNRKPFACEAAHISSHSRRLRTWPFTKNDTPATFFDTSAHLLSLICLPSEFIEIPLQPPSCWV
jgi:hypothetical protein